MHAQVDNGRLLRLCARLSAVTERAEHEGDPQWSETGVRLCPAILPSERAFLRSSLRTLRRVHGCWMSANIVTAIAHAEGWGARPAQATDTC